MTVWIYRYIHTTTSYYWPNTTGMPHIKIIIMSNTQRNDLNTFWNDNKDEIRGSASIRTVTHLWAICPKNRGFSLRNRVKRFSWRFWQLLGRSQLQMQRAPQAVYAGVSHVCLNGLQREDFLYISKSTLLKIQMKVPLLLLTLPLFSVLCRKSSNFSEGTWALNPS